MTVTRDVFGVLPEGPFWPAGAEVSAYTLTNGNGYALRCMTLGATLISVIAPDRDGTPQEITLGYDALERYVAGHPFFGSTVGRVCNRIGGAQFPLDGRTVTLSANVGSNLLHGGRGGFHVRLWDAEPFDRGDCAGVVFHRLSPDGEEGFPGTLDVTVTISLTEQNELLFEYQAEADAPTPVNLTNHAYWNLAGAPDLLRAAAGEAGSGRASGGDVLRPAAGPGGAIGGHELLLNASHYQEVDEASIPTGRIVPVAGKPRDFTEPQTIGSRIEQVPGGYDFSYVLNDADGNGERLAAVVVEPSSGRRMEVRTTLPAVQFYSGNKLTGQPARRGEQFERHDAFCLETQLYVDAMNHPEFPSVILRPGETFQHRTVHRFSLV